MWYLPFWVLFAIALILAGSAVAIRKLRFIDIQIFIMVAAITMACDMLFCKQYGLYHYVSMEYKGWYSFWANLIIIPALGVVFAKFIPKSIKGVVLYILVWTAAATMFEIFIAGPLGILHYLKWKVVPHSVIGYIIAFSFEYLYYRVLLKHCK